MNITQLFPLGLKLFSLQLALMFLAQLVKVIALLKVQVQINNPFTQSPTLMLPIYIGILFFYGFSAWILFSYSNAIAANLIKDKSTNEIITKELLLQLVLVFQGVSFLFVVIPNFVSFIFRTLMITPVEFYSIKTAQSLPIYSYTIWE